MSKSTDDLSSTCPLCYQDIKIYATGKCDHTICHVCSTRMRALCNQLYCPVCRTDLPQVVFMTRHHQFSGVITHRFPRDRTAKISFENNRVRLEYNKLLAHQCNLCDGRMSEDNFKMLQDHMRKDHALFYCDLCVEHLKIFTSERKCYSRKDLAQHRRKGDKEDTSYKGHPICEFCDKRYFDKDELLKHLRRDHYFCHFCDSTGISNQYYNDYDNLKVHFRESHFLCEQGDCEFEQFSHAFSSDIDLKAHKAASHGSSFSKFQARQNRKIDVEINHPPRPRERRGGGHGVGRGRAHLLYADDDDDDVQRALEASIHSAQSEDDKQKQQSKEQNNKRRKNSRKVPEEDYYDESHHRNHQPERGQTRPASGAAEGREDVPDPADFPGLLDGETKNSSPLMSSTWIKPQIQGPDFPELNPSAARDVPRPPGYPAAATPELQGYTAPRRQVGKNFNSLEDYPALGGSSGPTTNQSAPTGRTNSKQSPKMPRQKEQVSQSRPNSGAVHSSKNSAASKQSGKSKKAQKIDSLSEYPVLGAKGEPDRNHQRTSRELSSRGKLESEALYQTPSSSKPNSTGNKRVSNHKPGNVDSLSEYPALQGNKAPLSNNNHRMSTQTVQSKKDQSSRSSIPRNGTQGVSTETSTGADERSKPSPDPSFKTSSKDFPSLSSIATFLNNDKKSLEKENRKPAKSKKTGRAETTPAPPKKESSKLGVGSYSQPREPTLVKPPSQPGEQTLAKPPPGFITQPPPGFSSAPPPGFGSLPVCDVGYIPPPAAETNYVQPEDYKDRNKELVHKIKKCLKDKAGGFEEFRSLSGQYRTGIINAYEYYDECLALLGSHFRSIFDELVSLLPDVDKQQELLWVQQKRESSNHADTPSAVLKISKNSSAAPWKNRGQTRHKVCPQCQQMVLVKDYESHLNNHQDFPALGSSAPAKTRQVPNSAWGRMK